MEMYTLPNFCRVCLKYDKSLIDLEHIENEPNETLMSKLQQCVQEVEWTVFKPLLCHPCIKRLNIAYSFKKQCVQSASVLKNYVALVQETKKKNESQGSKESAAQGSAYMMLPNQKYIKIVVGGNQNQNNSSFQNVFLNVVPTAASSPVEKKNIPKNNSADPNQNVFLNINSTFQKYISTSPEKEKNVNTMLNENKTEELSVEIDPTVFGLDDGDSSSEEPENGADYEELISHTQIDSKGRSNGAQNGKADSKQSYGNYVPILPKQQQPNEDNFSFSGHHFLSSQIFPSDFMCEMCTKHFSSVKLLKNHFKEFHLGKFPFKCEYCYNEFVLRADYEACIKSHKIAESDPLNTSLTLRDFKVAAAIPEKAATLPSGPEHNLTPEETQDLICELCHRQFNSTSGLLRHKVRKHNQKNKKKYFVKGMKNAKCDICNREFSTQSYMQLHRKLHLRDDIGYKFKVFSKSRYTNKDSPDPKSTPEKNHSMISEEVTITPTIHYSDSDDDKNESQIDNQIDPLADSNNPDDDDDKMEIDLKEEEEEEEEEEEVEEIASEEEKSVSEKTD